MILVNLINQITKSDAGTFILCDEHFAKLESDNIESITKIRKLTHGFVGECIQCTDGDATPIDFDPVPENIEVFVTFDDDTDETWSASGTAGHLIYVSNTGEIFTTMEALRRRGVSKLYIEAGYELHLDS